MRYADDFLLGFTGAKQEVKTIKAEIGKFLESIQLEMSEEKTLIAHAKTEKARFLNYHISRMQDDGRAKRVVNHPKTGTHTRRTFNQQIHLSVPKDVTQSWVARVKKGKEVLHRTELMNSNDYDIVMTYETELQGLINYYTRA